MARKKKSEERPDGEPAAARPVDDDAAETQDGDGVDAAPESLAGEVEILPAVAGDEMVPEVAEAGEDESRERGIVPYDPLEAYLREISRYHSLKPEEEHELAVSYYKDKDREAAYRLISSNLWLVVKIARDYERAARNVLDLIQEGNIGLMEAVKNFDPYRGVRFPSYAVWWIKAYVIRYIMANWRLVKIGTTQAQRKLFFNLKKERDRLEREGFYPGPKLIAQNLNVRESDVIEMEQRLSGADVSVDAPLQEDSDSNLLAVMDSGQLSAEDLLARKEMQRLLTESLEEFASTLKEKELVIFRQRMLGEEKATLHDLAEQLKVSKERVRQLENRIREKLKEFLVARLGNSNENIDLEF